MTAPSTLRTCARLSLAASLLSAPAWAQTLLQTKVGDKANDRLGVCVRVAGDVNMDGVPDYIVGAPEDGNIFGAGEGLARVYNGATGGTIWTLNGVTSQDQFGASVDGIGDVNGDGRSDFAVGAPYFSGVGNSKGRVYVYSGMTGTVLWTADGPNTNDLLGTVVAAAGDVNGDGVPDVIGASREASGGGSLRGIAIVYNGATGAVIHTIQGTTNGQRLGLSADGIGDVNGDNRSDFAIGSLVGGVRVYSGATGGVLHTLPPPVADDVFGASVAGIGDVTGDGVRDLVVGATQDSNIFNLGPGYARVYNGATGAFVRQLGSAVVGDRLGIAVADAGDHNGDGKPEILVGADQHASALKGYARLYDGATGAVLHTFVGLVDGDRFGASLDGLGNLNGAGGPEVAIGAPDHTGSFTLNGRVEVWTPPAGGCPTPYTYCVANNNSTGSPALMGFSGTTSVSANAFTVNCTNLPPNTLGLFYYGSTEIQSVFGNGFRCVGGTAFRLGIQQVSAGGVVSRFLDVNTMPAGGALTPGATWKFQFWYRNAAAGGAGFNLSNGLSATFCN